MDPWTEAWRNGARMAKLNATWGRMALSASEVFWRRSLMMAQGAMTAAEATRMVSEKPAAFADAMMRASIASAKGASATRIAEAGLRPIARRARANARRLSR